MSQATSCRIRPGKKSSLWFEPWAKVLVRDGQLHVSNTDTFHIMLQGCISSVLIATLQSQICSSHRFGTDPSTAGGGGGANDCGTIKGRSREKKSTRGGQDDPGRQLKQQHVTYWPWFPNDEAHNFLSLVCRRPRHVCRSGPSFGLAGERAAYSGGDDTTSSKGMPGAGVNGGYVCLGKSQSLTRPC